jgi:hypothetical protein
MYTLSTVPTHILNVSPYIRQKTEIQYSLTYTSLTTAMLHMCFNQKRSILRPIILVSMYFLLLSLLGQLPFTYEDNDC